MEQNLTRYEIGSEFHWMGLPSGDFLPWPEPHVWYQTGRAALISLWKACLGKSDSVLLVPDYFCEEIVDCWEKNGIPIRRYSDNPIQLEPNWVSLTAQPGDVVLAVNYFGVRDGSVWHNWQAAHDEVVLVEDHTHDPFSSWALSSRADYAFASIRKSFAIPDGAISWSPKHLDLPSEPNHDDWEGSSLKLAAMILKMEYLKGSNWVSKDKFRELQIKGENALGLDSGRTISPWSRSLAGAGYPVEWREKRAENVKLLFSLLKDHPSMRPLFIDLPDSVHPFNAVFVFESKDFREECRMNLTQNNIYPSVHWPVNSNSSKELKSLADRILTIPVDQRYDEKDVQYIASLLLAL